MFINLIVAQHWKKSDEQEKKKYRNKSVARLNASLGI